MTLIVQCSIRTCARIYGARAAIGVGFPFNRPASCFSYRLTCYFCSTTVIKLTCRRDQQPTMPRSRAASGKSWTSSTSAAARPRTRCSKTSRERPITRRFAPSCGCSRRKGTSPTKRMAFGTSTCRRCPRRAARKSALRHLVETFFDGSAEQVVAAVLGRRRRETLGG